jgi:hypothetical protein
MVRQRKILTRKEAAIAGVISRIGQRNTRERVTEEMAKVLGETDPCFNRGAFVLVCGMTYKPSPALKWGHNPPRIVGSWLPKA